MFCKIQKKSNGKLLRLVYVAFLYSHHLCGIEMHGNTINVRILNVLLVYEIILNFTSSSR